MISNYLKIAWRNIRKKPMFSAINIFGLATGLACAFLIYLWVHDEQMTDKFHTNEANLYQIMERSKENDVIRIQESTQGPLSEVLEKEFPEVEHAVTVMNLEKEGMEVTFKNEDKSFKSTGIFASTSFFEVFTFPLISGNKSAVLTDKNAVVISESLAIKLFGSTENAMNKDVGYNFFGKDHLCRITGVYKNVPGNSTLKFDYVLTKQKLIEDIWPNGKNWYNTGPQTYVLLKDQTNQLAFDKKIKSLIDNYDKGNIFTLFTRKFSDAYLKDNYVNGIQEGGRITYVRLFTLVAALVLLIACINFMNMSTARVTGRFKEIGIKKVVGTTRKMLIAQFLTESLFLTFIAMLLAILLVFLLMPVFNYITGKNLTIAITLSNLLFLLLLTLVTGLLAGSYPAFYMSGFTPLATLKGKFSSKGGELFVRKGLVVFQFMASLILIISVLIINNQVNYAMDKSIGYNKENVVYFDLEGKAYQNTTSFFNSLQNLPGVVDAGGINQTLIREDGGSSTYGINWPGKIENKNIDFIIRSIDENLTQTLNIKMADGKAFSKELGALNSYLIINEEAARLMNLQQPVGTKVVLWGEEKTILGVMKDFHTASIMQPISPVIFQYEPDNLSLAMVRIKEGSDHATLDNIKKFYQDYNPGYEINLQFLDDTFKAQYSSEQRVLKLSGYFAYMAILISCLGLMGLAAFNTELRRKEIGIRKVLGASVFGILSMLSLDFLKLVIISLLLASPVAWYIMNGWLSQFVYKTDMNWWVFALGGVLTLVIAAVTVCLQTLKAAVANPVKSIRTE